MIAAFAVVLLQAAPTPAPFPGPASPAPATPATAVQSSPAQAPAGPEWISAQDDDVKAAVLMYGGGLSLSVLCRDERLGFLIGGLTPSDQEARTLQVNAQGDDLRNSTWIVGADRTTATSFMAGLHARRLRVASKLTVRIPSAGGAPARRYEFPLPASHATLDAVLESCNEPLENDADAGMQPELSVVAWERRPLPNFPNQGMGTRFASVFLDCLTGADGLVTDCNIISEDPRHQGFGDAAIASTRQARVRSIGGEATALGARIKFRITFRLG